VHAVLLPSGKVLMISGSSWRNLEPVQYYPEFPSPKPGTGLFVRGTEPFKKDKSTDKLPEYYQLVNNAGIYDPEKNTFYRIPHPVPEMDPDSPGHFAPNDLFCTGQMHLPDGNVLFTGGTQYYSPYRTGNRSTWLFDWKKELTIDWRKVDWRQVPVAGANADARAPRPTAGPEQYPWIFAGFMKRGRWYPTIVPLRDGRMVVVSGFVGFDKDYPEKGKTEMYVFEINHFLEFFDPSKFDPANPSAAWKSVDVSRTPNSPFTVMINEKFQPTPQYGDDVCGERCKQDNQHDAFKLYPEIYQMPDGRLYFTREGDWVSLRTCDTAFMRKTQLTYWASLNEDSDHPKVEFARGPERLENVTSYGTSLLDPNTGNIEILGGQPTSPGTLYPLNAEKPTHFAGGRGSRRLETFHPSASEPHGGSWTLDHDFLGKSPQEDRKPAQEDRKPSPEDRTMHYALVLPTRQVLVINGGNYDFYGPVFNPLLLTPQFHEGKFTNYVQKRMADALEPRLYHNVALLLPDATVLVAGGNTARATVHRALIPPPDPDQGVQPKPDSSQIDLDVYFYGDGPMAKGRKGMLTTPTENWVAERYSPPYMFIDGGRQAEIAGLKPPAGTKYAFAKTLGEKTYYLLHSNQTVEMTLRELPASCSNPRSESLALIKLPSVTHGWDAGQRFIEVPITQGSSQAKVGSDTRKVIRFDTPDAGKENIPPGYYMLFYVDCAGKPSKAQMVRFDDKVETL
ncbi:MAG: galactose oxidase early set domain-containing protein, partial [Isosphaeraceae bacterium]